MIKITKYKAIDKGFLLGTFSIEVVEWKLYINEMTYFQKGPKRWIGMPSRSYEVDNVKNYYPYVGFTDQGRSGAFQEAVIKALDEYLAQMPKEPATVQQPQAQQGMAPSVKYEQGELPF